MNFLGKIHPVLSILVAVGTAALSVIEIIAAQAAKR